MNPFQELNLLDIWITEMFRELPVITLMPEALLQSQALGSSVRRSSLADSSPFQRWVGMGGGVPEKGRLRRDL